MHVTGIDAQFNKTIIENSAKILSASSLEYKFSKVFEKNDEVKPPLRVKVNNVFSSVSWTFGRIAKDLITITQKKDEKQEENEVEAEKKKRERK